MPSFNAQISILGLSLLLVSLVPFLSLRLQNISSVAITLDSLRGSYAQDGKADKDTSYFLRQTDGRVRQQLHFVVSSDCSPYQRWQVLTQIHSAVAVGQTGRFTWIVSGCPDPEGKHNEGKKRKIKRQHTKSKAHGQDNAILNRTSILADIETHFPSLCSPSKSSKLQLSCPSTHFSPDYSDMRVYGGPFADGKKKRSYTESDGKTTYSYYQNEYRFNNKPNGLKHWSESADSGFDPNSNEAIVLIDPDFLFLRQFSLPDNAVVAPGKPTAANYGLGSPWNNSLSALWLEFNRSAICGAESRCVETTSEEFYKYYSAGPPYIIHSSDVLRLSIRWSELVPPTYDEYPLLYAEMLAYSMAAADLNLPHTLFEGLFTGGMTYWPPDDIVILSTSAQRFIDAFDSSTEDVLVSDAGVKSCFADDLIPPPFLHYCQRYPFRLNNGTSVVVAKRRITHDSLNCGNDEAMLPQDEGREPSAGGFTRNREEYWHALAACGIIRGVAYAKKQGCS